VGVCGINSRAGGVVCLGGDEKRGEERKGKDGEAALEAGRERKQQRRARECIEK